MEQALGFPEFDPHGDPIPPRHGSMPTITDVTLTEVPVGTRCVVSRVSDRHPEHLRHIDGLGIRPGVHLQVLDLGGGNELRLHLSSGDHTIPTEIADGIRVTLDPG